jgi:hypothetical protein
MIQSLGIYGKMWANQCVIVDEIVSAEPSIQKVDRDSDMAPDLIRYTRKRNSFEEYFTIW